jgi:beta-glucanase (GH16 family)
MKKHTSIFVLILLTLCSFQHLTAQTFRHNKNTVSTGTSKYTKNNKLKLVWSDEFDYDGLPDSTKWGYDVGTGDWGWGNNEQQFYTNGERNNVIVGNGVLSIIARKEKRGDKNYTSTRMLTRGKADWANGRIEIRAKLPKGRGTWPAGWTLGANLKEVGWPLCGEIDIMEHVGYDPDTIIGSFHSTAFNHIKGTQKTKRIGIKNPYTQFHVYSVEWNAQKMDFMLDGVVYLSVANTGKTDEEWPFNKPQYILLNLAIGGNWGGTKGIDESIFPATLQVDYVRVFQ